MRHELAERGVDVLAPVPDGVVDEDHVGKREFTIDPAGGTVTCPAGNTAQITTSKKGRADRADLASDVRHLPAEGQVLPRASEPADRARRARRTHDRCPPSAQRPRHRCSLRHTRPRIERLLGLLACRSGARKSRYIGSEKATFQASWAAALVNLNPIGHHHAIATS